MALKSRRKGSSFERKIAKFYRALFPGRVVRRALQAQKAWEPDVVVEGVSLWTECNDAQKPNPAKKMAQALRDRSKSPAYAGALPVVIWHRLGSPTIQASILLDDLIKACGQPGIGYCMPQPGPLVTLDLEDFGPILAQRFVTPSPATPGQQ